ncbi:MAG TPA: arsenate reductase ArsC [Candidatus Saccharimonadales bacterium]|nr:arsenate reductase ArsC [Candidatus Saccharimonadales bacterium]
MGKPRVLFVCIGNSARSQMAEAWLRLWAGDRYEPVSAGTHPIPVHPLTVKVMQEVGADMSQARSQSVRELSGPFEYVITTCAEAEVDCPALRGTRGTIRWHIPDPVGRASILSKENDRVRAFRRARDLIGGRVDEFLALHPGHDPEDAEEIP